MRALEQRDIGGTEVVAAQQTVARTSRRRAPSFTPVGAVLAAAIIGIAVALALQIGVEVWPPVHAGGTSAVLGEGAQPCAAETEDVPPLCYAIPFEEGREVGVGMTVRNDAPIPMTILAAQVIRDGVKTPAILEPQLTTGDVEFGFPAGIGFEPIEVAPGAELPIQFVGTYGDCEAVARDYLPGSGLSVSQVFLTVRWAIFQTETTVPLTSSLALMAPNGCPESAP